jgi:HK97 family phage major capsid protein
MWIEELDEQGNPVNVAELTASQQASVRYEEREMKAVVTTVFGKISTQFLKYQNKLVGYVRNNLMKRMDIKIEDGLFNGDGNAPNPKGLITYATAYTGGGLATTNPTYADVFRGLALQVTKAFGIATRVFVKPDILAQMDVEKDEEGQYVIPPFRSADGTKVAGITLIETNALSSTDFDFVGGDLSVVNVEMMDEFVVQIGLSGNDLTDRKRTIFMETEYVQFVSANDTQVLVKGTISAAKELITAS